MGKSYYSITIDAPKHIEQWCHAENDLRSGGKFKTVMASKDGKTKFDFEGGYTDVKTHELIAYAMSDGRKVSVIFTPLPEHVENNQ